MRRCGLYIFVFLFSVVRAFASETPLLDKAEALYQSKAYEQAAEIFSNVLAGTEDADLRQQCLLRLGDCIQMGWLEGRGTSDTYYAQVLEQGYSPYLLQAFRKWRASYQEAHHGKTNRGMATFTENELYNRKKAEVLVRIDNYLKDHPQDAVAIAQRESLRQLADIAPGGPFGSSVLDESAELWPEFSE
ncbi:MAG: hypothetical protein Q8R91_03970 [Candidatus Omnitrophota bacterium]|nr:hypothetical protein [Candidatus Omnitrophota bacterium]